MSAWVVGVDVGGRRKGLHAAARRLDSPEVRWLAAAADGEALVRALLSAGIHPAVVAIDAPPRGTRWGEPTRSAERALHRQGYRIQWTRRAGEPVPEWMEVGAELWATLSHAFPEARLVETFPTAVSDRLDRAETVLPLRLLVGRERRVAMKDWIDAVLALDVAARMANDAVEWFGDVDDPDGRIAV